jgi:hypothetical protein
MNANLSAVLLTGLVLAGCCTSVYPPSSDRIDGQEWGDTSVCGIFSGWGTTNLQDRSEALYTPVTVAEYTRYLCGHIDIKDYATCANRIGKFYRDSFDGPTQPGESTSGPFAVLIDDDLLVGSYRSDPFSASFRVSSTRSSCQGSYNAMFGDTDAIFNVWCDSGKRGSARVVRDRYGRDGIGVVTMDDGTKGTIVFGPRIAKAARSAL